MQKTGRAGQDGKKSKVVLLANNVSVRKEGSSLKIEIKTGIKTVAMPVDREAI